MSVELLFRIADIGLLMAVCSTVLCGFSDMAVSSCDSQILFNL